MFKDVMPLIADPVAFRETIDRLAAWAGPRAPDVILGAEALVQGRLGGAALDVTDPEPLPTDSPLLTAPNVLLAPHIASASHATRGRMASMAADNLLAALEGRRPPHCVNPELFS